MNGQRLGELRVEFPGGSWAIWSEDFPDAGCVERQADRLTEFIESRSDRMRPEVVLLSTNPAGRRPLGYRNFHSPDRTDHDHVLKRCIQAGELSAIRGAYMTDLLPTSPAPDESTLDPEAADVDQFLDQLAALGKASYDVICLCPDAFDALGAHVDAEPLTLPHDLTTFTTSTAGLTLTVYRVRGYSTVDPGSAAEEQFDRQLKQINDRIGQ